MAKMTDQEFVARVKAIGYVEACVESVKRDGHPFDEAAMREQARNAVEIFGKRGLLRKDIPGTADRGAETL